MSNNKLNVQHVTRLFRQASAAQVQAGIDWYDNANDIAAALAIYHDIEFTTVCGIIAALSPLQSWGANVNLANQFLASQGTMEKGYLGRQLSKARSIYQGTDPCDVLGGNKTIAFYFNIYYRGTSSSVTIDRHAWDAATNTRNTDETRPSLRGKRYQQAVDVYTAATRLINAEQTELRLSAPQVQAIAWLVWRQKFWSAGAFDNYEKIGE